MDGHRLKWGCALPRCWVGCSASLGVPTPSKTLWGSGNSAFSGVAAGGEAGTVGRPSITTPLPSFDGRDRVQEKALLRNLDISV